VQIPREACVVAPEGSDVAARIGRAPVRTVRGRVGAVQITLDRKSVPAFGEREREGRAAVARESAGGDAAPPRPRRGATWTR
jgi:hypothetical protein